MMNWRIVPYRPGYETALLELESTSPQGSHIRLEMIRDRFRARSEVFDDFGIFLAVSEDGGLLGVVAGSAVTLERNGSRERVGYVYDLRVAPGFRRQGIARALGNQLTREYFPSLSIDRYVSTVKAGNRPAIRALQRALGTGCDYPFVYLTIPTGMRIAWSNGPGSDSSFGVSVFGMRGLAEWVYRHPEGGPALFRTDRAYRVRPVSISPWLNVAMRALETFKGPAWKLPRLGEEVRFATAFDLRPDNLCLLDDLLEYLQRRGVQYLMVCCLKDDRYYRDLRRCAVNSMGYRVLGSLPLRPSDSLTLDVRCL